MTWEKEEGRESGERRADRGERRGDRREELDGVEMEGDI